MENYLSSAGRGLPSVRRHGIQSYRYLRLCKESYLWQVHSCTEGYCRDRIWGGLSFDMYTPLSKVVQWRILYVWDYHVRDTHFYLRLNCWELNLCNKDTPLPKFIGTVMMWLKCHVNLLIWNSNFPVMCQIPSYMVYKCY